MAQGKYILQGMYGYALRHPRKNANPNIKNNRGLTSLTLSCELGRDNIFRSYNKLLERFWRIPLYVTDDAIAKLDGTYILVK